MKAQRFLFLFLFLFALLSSSAYSIEVTRHLSGSWYNVDQDGHGLSVEILGNGTAVVYWFVYNPDGTPTFLIAQGPYSGDQIVATAYHVSGMRWGIFNPLEKTVLPWGEIVMTFQDCRHANLNYLAAHNDTSIPYGGGDIPMVRLSNIDHLQCNDNPFAGIYEGVLERDEDGVSHRTKAVVSAENGFAVYVEGAFMAFGDFGEPNVDEAWSDNAVILPFEPQASAIPVPDFSARVQSTNRMLLTYYTQGPFGYGSGDLPALDEAFRRGVTLDGPSAADSIERRYWLQDLNSGDYAATEIAHTGEFTAVSDRTQCSWTGLVAVPDPMFNLLNVSFDVGDCGETNGHYTGYGYHADGHEFYTNRVVYVFARSETRPMALALVPRS